MPLTGKLRRAEPQTDVQALLDAAAPGDTILLAPGAYYQDLLVRRSGAPGAPITIRAERPGTVTLSGAHEEASRGLRFQRVAGDLFCAAVPWRVWWIMVDGRNQVNYGTVDHLKRFAFPRGDSESPCAPEGFAWCDGKLYVRLRDGHDPDQANIEIHRPGGYSTADTAWDKEWCFEPDFGYVVPGHGLFISRTLANLTVEGDHIVIEGLRLHMGVGASVVVHGHDVTVRDCHMSGAHLGVQQPDQRIVPTGGEDRCAAGYVRTARGLTVEHCEFSGYPLYQWAREDQDWWGGLYRSSAAVVAMNYGGPGSVVRHNWFYECFDALEPRGNGTLHADGACDCSHNLIMNCADDSIEFDSRTPMNLRLHHNVIVDGMCVLALSPVMGGGLLIDHNLVYVSPEHGLKRCVLFKMGSPWGSGLPTQGVTIVHNTLINTRMSLYWCGDDHRYVENVLENNILHVAQSCAWRLPGFEVSPHNLYCGPAVAPDHLPHVLHAQHAGFAGLDPLDIRLCESSSAVDSGAPAGNYHHTARGRAPDLGALELGEEWEFPTPGPRWAQDKPPAGRPDLPKSLSARLAGLG